MEGATAGVLMAVMDGSPTITVMGAVAPTTLRSVWKFQCPFVWMQGRRAQL